eukprot:bmy_07084T0
MLALISRLLDWFRSLFWKEEMELTLVGLQYSGKTTFVNVIALLIFTRSPRGQDQVDCAALTGKVFFGVPGNGPNDLTSFNLYIFLSSCLCYMIDAADREKIEASRNELHNLLDKPQLQGIPVLVLGNKRDLPNALDEKQLIEKMNLSAIQDREICCYSISCKEKDNIGQGMKNSRIDTDIYISHFSGLFNIQNLEEAEASPEVFQSFLAIILELLSVPLKYFPEYGPS